MGNYFEGTLVFRFNKENGDKLLEDLKVLLKKEAGDKDLSDFSDLMKDAKWLTHPRAFYPNFEINKYYNMEGEIVSLTLVCDDTMSDTYKEALQEVEAFPTVGYELKADFCMKLYLDEFDLGAAMVDFFRPYLDKSLYNSKGHIGTIFDEGCTYNKRFFVEVPEGSKSVPEDVKNNAIRQLKEIYEELEFLITQLQLEDKAFCHCPEIASIVAGIEGMEWGCGTNPSGEKMFTAYFTNY